MRPQPRRRPPSFKQGILCLLYFLAEPSNILFLVAQNLIFLRAILVILQMQAYILCNWIILSPPPSSHRKINFAPRRRIFFFFGGGGFFSFLYYFFLFLILQSPKYFPCSSFILHNICPWQNKSNFIIFSCNFSIVFFTPFLKWLAASRVVMLYLHIIVESIYQLWLVTLLIVLAIFRFSYYYCLG